MNLVKKTRRLLDWPWGWQEPVGTVSDVLNVRRMERVREAQKRLADGTALTQIERRKLELIVNPFRKLRERGK